MQFEKLLKQYEKLLVKFNKSVDKNDNEIAHLQQDELYEKFIKEISENKFKSIEEISTISSLLKNNFDSKKFDKWYS
jgi:hypothetical protein